MPFSENVVPLLFDKHIVPPGPLHPSELLDVSLLIEDVVELLALTLGSAADSPLTRRTGYATASGALVWRY